MKKIVIALGGNRGNVPENFARAARALARNGVCNLRMSRLYRTRPVGCPSGTPDFFNAALTGDYAGEAETLFALMQALEVASGRPLIHGFHTARTLDLDLILFGDDRIETPRLTVPHPRAHERKFVLEPLAEIAPGLRFPGETKNVRELLEKLP